MVKHDNGEFAAAMIGTSINCLLDRYSKTEIKRMLTTKKMHELVDYLDNQKKTNHNTQ